jgi:hypothetical protein
MSLDRFRKIAEMAIETDIAGEQSKHHYKNVPLVDWLE